MSSQAKKIIEELIQYTGETEPIPLDHLESVLCDYYEDYGDDNEYAVVHKNVMKYLEDKFVAPTFSKFAQGSDEAITFTLSVGADPSVDLGFVYSNTGKLALAYAYEIDGNGDTKDLQLKRFENLRKDLEKMLRTREVLSPYDPFNL